MFAGLDLGTTLIKMVRGSEPGNLHFSVNPYGRYGLDLFEEDNARKLAWGLLNDGVKTVALTGSQAERFTPIAADAGLEVVVSDLDPIQHELVMQANGMRQLLAEQGFKPDEFMLVSIGTGTSFTLVRSDEVKQYAPGLSVGGRTLTQLALMRDITPDRIGAYAKDGSDVDLLMKHLYPDAGVLKGQFVLASMGRLGHKDVPKSVENYCFGLLKMIATLTIGHVMSIRGNKEWAWKGPIVFMGTPVSEYEVLRDLLLKFSVAIGLRAHVPKWSNFAGALGAFQLAKSGGKGMYKPPQVGLIKRCLALLAHYKKTLQVMLKKSG